MAPVDTSRKVVASNRRLSKEEREKLTDEQQLAEARESIRKRGWSEGEVKWRAWLATRGHDVQVNDWNLHKYVDGECIPPSRDPFWLNANEKELPDYEAGNDGEGGCARRQKPERAHRPRGAARSRARRRGASPTR